MLLFLNLEKIIADANTKADITLPQSGGNIPEN